MINIDKLVEYTTIPITKLKLAIIDDRVSDKTLGNKLNGTIDEGFLFVKPTLTGFTLGSMCNNGFKYEKLDKDYKHLESACIPTHKLAEFREDVSKHIFEDKFLNEACDFYAALGKEVDGTVFFYDKNNGFFLPHLFNLTDLYTDLYALTKKPAARDRAEFQLMVGNLPTEIPHNLTMAMRLFKMHNPEVKVGKFNVFSFSQEIILVIEENGKYKYGSPISKTLEGLLFIALASNTVTLLTTARFNNATVRNYVDNILSMHSNHVKLLASKDVLLYNINILTNHISSLEGINQKMQAYVITDTDRHKESEVKLASILLGNLLGKHAIMAINTNDYIVDELDGYIACTTKDEPNRIKVFNLYLHDGRVKHDLCGSYPFNMDGLTTMVTEYPILTEVALRTNKYHTDTIIIGTTKKGTKVIPVDSDNVPIVNTKEFIRTPMLFTMFVKDTPHQVRIDTGYDLSKGQWHNQIHFVRAHYRYVGTGGQFYYDEEQHTITKAKDGNGNLTWISAHARGGTKEQRDELNERIKGTSLADASAYLI